MNKCILILLFICFFFTGCSIGTNENEISTYSNISTFSNVSTILYDEYMPIIPDFVNFTNPISLNKPVVSQSIEIDNFFVDFYEKPYIILLIQDTYSEYNPPSSSGVQNSVYVGDDKCWSVLFVSLPDWKYGKYLEFTYFDNTNYDARKSKPWLLSFMPVSGFGNYEYVSYKYNYADEYFYSPTLVNSNGSNQIQFSYVLGSSDLTGYSDIYPYFDYLDEYKIIINESYNNTDIASYNWWLGINGGQNPIPPIVDESVADGSTGDGSTGDGSTGDGSTGGGSTGDGSTGDGSTGDGSTGDGSTGDGSTGDGSNGDGSTGDGSTGDGSTGDGSTENNYGDKLEPTYKNDDFFAITPFDPNDSFFTSDDEDGRLFIPLDEFYGWGDYADDNNSDDFWNFDFWEGLDFSTNIDDYFGFFDVQVEPYVPPF